MNYQPPSLTVPAERLPDTLLDPQVALRRHLRIGMLLVGLLIFCLFGTAALVGIQGAVIAVGQISVQSKVKKIGHPTGGVVAEIYVKDGDRVKAGDALMRLESRVAGVSAAVTGEGLDQLLAARARLEAERDGRRAVVFPVQLAQRQDPSARSAMAEQDRLFRLRKEARLGQHAQLTERVRQLEQQIRGYQSQIGANQRQAQLIQPELAGVRELWQKKLVTINKINQLERAAIDLDANIASLRANIAQSRAHITEIRQQDLQLEQETRSQAGAELAEVVAKLADQQVRTVSSEDVFDKSIIRAPYNGVVDKLTFSTIGGVIPPAQTIMEIVPDTDRMTVEAKISPADVDQLTTGLEARLRFSAFNTQTTPELSGQLAHVSAETQTDERTGSSFYNVRIDVEDGELRKLGNLRLVPGMPVEAYIQTGERSLLSYITKPLRDQLSRAFRHG